MQLYPWVQLYRTYKSYTWNFKQVVVMMLDGTTTPLIAASSTTTTIGISAPVSALTISPCGSWLFAGVGHTLQAHAPLIHPTQTPRPTAAHRRTPDSLCH